MPWLYLLKWIGDLFDLHAAGVSRRRDGGQLLSQTSRTNQYATSTAAVRRTYDHRVREVVCSTQDPTIFPTLSIPRSTASGWLSKGPRPVVESIPFLIQLGRLGRQLEPGPLAESLRLIVAHADDGVIVGLAAKG